MRCAALTSKSARFSPARVRLAISFGTAGNQQIKAITGYKTDKEVSRYTAAADQVRLAEQAMAATYGMEQE
ncbi:hypothetical protein [Xanthobacter agilis]|uniref:Integrase n=1 Tax=Xanthobacter agilis TaxID=47492 RepID=A0ABU0LEU3_XANAG|nr:hypothetical protein [Xanthobacter agilis]MDQ0505653.1 hypothetical protein [Xanthobacter agilis]